MSTDRHADTAAAEERAAPGPQNEASATPATATPETPPADDAHAVSYTHL